MRIQIFSKPMQKIPKKIKSFHSIRLTSRISLYNLIISSLFTIFRMKTYFLKLARPTRFSFSRSLLVLHGLLRLHDIRQLQGLPHRTHRHLGAADAREQPRHGHPGGGAALLPQRLRRVPNGGVTVG